MAAIKYRPRVKLAHPTEGNKVRARKMTQKEVRALTAKRRGQEGRVWKCCAANGPIARRGGHLQMKGI